MNAKKKLCVVIMVWWGGALCASRSSSHSKEVSQPSTVTQSSKKQKSATTSMPPLALVKKPSVERQASTPVLSPRKDQPSSDTRRLQRVSSSCIMSPRPAEETGSPHRRVVIEGAAQISTSIAEMFRLSLRDIIMVAQEKMDAADFEKCLYLKIVQSAWQSAGLAQQQEPSSYIEQFIQLVDATLHDILKSNVDTQVLEEKKPNIESELEALRKFAHTCFTSK